MNFGQSYGEWAEPRDVFPNDWKNTVLPNPEESTAYTSYVLGLMCEIAEYMNDEKMCGCLRNILTDVPRHTGS